VAAVVRLSAAVRSAIVWAGVFGAEPE
jgi:hypothetical protein